MRSVGHVGSVVARFNFLRHRIRSSQTFPATYRVKARSTLKRKPVRSEDKSMAWFRRNNKSSHAEEVRAGLAGSRTVYLMDPYECSAVLASVSTRIFTAITCPITSTSSEGGIHIASGEGECGPPY